MIKKLAAIDFDSKKINCHCGESWAWDDVMIHYCPHCRDYYFICGSCGAVDVLSETDFQSIDSYVSESLAAESRIADRLETQCH